MDRQKPVKILPCPKLRLRAVIKYIPFSLGSRCAFAAQGSGSDSQRTINSSPIVFDKVDLNVCNGYDVTTGKQISTWSQVRLSRRSDLFMVSLLFIKMCWVQGHVACGVPYQDAYPKERGGGKDYILPNTIGGCKGGPGTHAPRVQILSCSFRQKVDQIIPLWELAPPSGKSWIRH